MNGNKRINNLKRLVIIISIAILIVGVILIMSIYNNKFGKVGGSSEGGRSTVSTTTSTDIIIDPDADETTTTTAGEETTTTEAVTTASTKTNKTNVRTQAPTGGSQVVTQPSKNYTIIADGASGYENSVSNLEWATVQQLNKLRGGNNLMMASELRATAETAANNAVDSLIWSEKNAGCSKENGAACKCDFGNIRFEGAAYCANYVGSVEGVVNSLKSKNPGILDADYKYVGVGVIKKEDRYSYVIIVD